ncbi:hypothetical protein L7F22_011521 [Adiantum nelumboides]|nr:hypothetical protein [Adiantum nelumboides]
MESSASRDSYAHNSALQNRNFHAIAKPRLHKAIAHLMHSRSMAGHEGPKQLAVADLGCSYGRNTIDCALFILQTLRHHFINSTPSAKHNIVDAEADHAEAAGAGEEEEEEEQGMEVHYFFSDLPSNDFNALFRALDALQRRDEQQGLDNMKMYAAGVPGSFHSRLFPSASLDFVVCCYSLHWLSQVPPSILDRSSPSWNGGSTWIYKSAKEVLNAYSLQAKVDIRSFIRNRAHEMRSGGVLFLFVAGSSQVPNYCPQAHRKTLWEIFDTAWFELVEEGTITLEEMEMFNMPMFFLSKDELKSALMEAPEFQLLQLESIENIYKQDNLSLQEWGSFLTSVTKPIVSSYLGPYKTIKLYERMKALTLHQHSIFMQLMHCLLVASLQRL